ncbi:hypothetical protein SAMN06273572_102122 [Monaibacterium marinum]|uniref:Uncharacterized protein n=1 Tax=Pontivivens marinum TaxID=1690039 RepID=A0A2C9CQ17_9RHOB|nr:hypothetical protein [Monaibacterium marinum]SOH93446.1 hypothetical protein SAMN06273572_102122 [Monaibacterium marinum]
MDGIIFLAVAIVAAALVIFAVTARKELDDNVDSDDHSNNNK